MTLRAFLVRADPRRSFLARLLAFSLVMVLLLSGASVLAVVYVAGASLTQEAGSQAHAEAATVRQLLDDHRVALAGFTTALAGDAQLQADLVQATPEAAERQLARLTPPGPQIGVGLFRPDGTLLANRGPFPSLTPAEVLRMPAFAGALSNRVGGGTTVLGSVPAEVGAARVGTPVAAVLLAEEPIDDALLARIALIVGDDISIVRGQRRIGGSSSALRRPLPAEWARALAAGSPATLAGADGNAQRVVAVEPLRAADRTVSVHLLVERRVASSASLVSALARAVILITLVIAVFAVLALAVFTRNFLHHPIAELSTDVERITSGDLARPVRPARVAEFTRLARGIDLMRRELARNIRQVEIRGLISRNLHQRSPMEVQLQRVVTLAAEMLGSRQALLLTHVVGMGGFDFTLNHGFPEDPDRLWLLSDHGIVPRHLRSREGGFWNDLAGDGGELERWLPMENCLVLPLVMGEQHRGALYFFNKPGGFNAEDQRVAEGLAEEVVIAFEKSMLLVVSQRQATTDPLTGLYNYRFLVDYLEHTLRLARRLKQPVALLMLDLDRFKSLNDEHGHLLGDAALRAFAETLARTIRGSDLAARYGGEEFVVIMPDTNTAEAELVAEKIRQAVAEIRLPLAPGRTINFTVSVGGAVRHPDGGGLDDADQLLETADRALYRAKNEGRNRVVLDTEGGPLSQSQPALRKVL